MYFDNLNSLITRKAKILSFGEPYNNRLISRMDMQVVFN